MNVMGSLAVDSNKNAARNGELRHELSLAFPTAAQYFPSPAHYFLFFIFYKELF